jgi:hypothetical protein
MNSRWLVAFLAALRPSSWDADRAAAARNGWTVEHGRFGRVLVRDPRFDQLRPRRPRAGEPVPESARRSVASGRWL